jgi:hypothetical protein
MTGLKDSISLTSNLFSVSLDVETNAFHGSPSFAFFITNRIGQRVTKPVPRGNGTPESASKTYEKEDTVINIRVILLTAVKSMKSLSIIDNLIIKKD